MSNGWENYTPAPIEIFHSEAETEFHKGAQFKPNETFVGGMRFINGIEFNRLLAIFKVKIMKEYNITSDAIPKNKVDKDLKEIHKLANDKFQATGEHPILSAEPMDYALIEASKLDKDIADLKNLSSDLWSALEQARKQYEVNKFEPCNSFIGYIMDKHSNSFNALVKNTTKEALEDSSI